MPEQLNGTQPIHQEPCHHQIKETTIETLEESLRQAMLNSDISALDELIADDLVFTLPTGLVIDK
ncbi:nuclear transport factor 2 family protein [Phormidesmis priestleyi]